MWILLINGPFEGKIQELPKYVPFVDFAMRPTYYGVFSEEECKQILVTVRYRHVGTDGPLLLFSLVKVTPPEELDLSDFDRRLLHQCKISSE